MDEKQSSSAYREKAAELRTVAERTSDFAASVELETAADNYDKLANFVEKVRPLPPR